MRARLFLLALLAIFGLLHSTSGEEDEFGLMESGEVEATEPGIKEFDPSEIEAREFGRSGIEDTEFDVRGITGHYRKDINTQRPPPRPVPIPPLTIPPRPTRRPRPNRFYPYPQSRRPGAYGISGRYIVDIRPYRGGPRPK